MATPESSGNWEMSEQDRILSSLLDKVDVAISRVGTAHQGAPLFAVEAELIKMLECLIPEAKFTAADIRCWAASISS